jgi:hypothetical protein
VWLLASNPPQATGLRAHITPPGPCRIGYDSACRGTNDAACKCAANRIGGHSTNHASRHTSNSRAAEHTILPCGFAAGKQKCEGSNNEQISHRFSPSIPKYLTFLRIA